MKQGRVAVLFLFAIASALLFLSNSALAKNDIEFLDKELIKKLNNGIYEVVTPKLESAKIQYEKELPFDRLDFKERNEKYYSIGTAFFINDKEMMTAEHVLGLMYFSLQQKFFVRDAAGAVYPVGKLRKYSTRRDMIVFDLQEYPKTILPLKLNRQVDIGDTVFSAGNAQGEGIAYRAGQVASFTDEPEYGTWKNIRFSSPASPGNSGGPLLNLAGEVVGLIVRKNQSENYNIAVPISEFDHLAANKAEFDVRNITVEVRGTDETMVRDWSYTLPLPASVADIAGKVEDALDAFYRSLRVELTEKVKGKDFPLGKRFRDYLRNQPVFQGVASLSPDTDFNIWNAASYSLEKVPLSAEQNVYRGRSLHFDMQAIVEKPAGTALKDFLASPKGILDSLLKAVPYYRFMGPEKIRIISLGEPEKKTVWQDKLGRKWTSSLWHSEYNNYFVYSHCLPYPKGALCILSDGPVSDLKLDYLPRLQEGCDEIALGYEGEVDDWAEYLALDKEELPLFFRQAQVKRDGSRLQVRLKDFGFDFSTPKITGKSELHLHLGYSNEQLLAEDLVRFELVPEQGSIAHYRIQPLFEPSAFDAETYKASWSEGLKAAGEFSGKVISTGEQQSIQKTVPETRKTLTAFDGQKMERVFAVGCAYKTAEDKSNLEQDCGAFLQSIKFF